MYFFERKDVFIPPIWLRQAELYFPLSTTLLPAAVSQDQDEVCEHLHYQAFNAVYGDEVYCEQYLTKYPTSPVKAVSRAFLGRRSTPVKPLVSFDPLFSFWQMEHLNLQRLSKKQKQDRKKRLQYILDEEAIYRWVLHGKG